MSQLTSLRLTYSYLTSTTTAKLTSSESVVEIERKKRDDAVIKLENLKKSL